MQQGKSARARLYDGFILLLSVYVVVQLSLEIIREMPPNLTELFSVIDFAICVIFLLDWVVFLILSKEKAKYVKSRSFDLVASIPFIQILRPFRIFRIVRLLRALRLLRGLKGILPIVKRISASPARSALTIYLSITTVVYFYCSLGLYNFEREVNSQIGNFGDVLWMAFITMTSVGYGDISPKTTGGRIMAIVLVITGLGLFSLVTAEIATKLLKYVKKPDRGGDAGGKPEA
jgi:voltage-gated potassium channel